MFMEKIKLAQLYQIFDKTDEISELAMDSACSLAPFSISSSPTVDSSFSS